MKSQTAGRSVFKLVRHAPANSPGPIDFLEKLKALTYVIEETPRVASIPSVKLCDKQFDILIDARRAISSQ